MFDNLRADIRQFSRFGPWYRKLGFWVAASYRLSAWAERLPDGAARNVARLVSSSVAAPARVLKNVHLSPGARIGPGLLILHPLSIVVPPGSELGPNCQLFDHVFLGPGPIPGLPRLGRDVILYAGAKVLGGVSVGDGAEIGTNAVVISEVAGGSLVSAPDARVIPRATAVVLSAPEARAYAAGASRRDPGSKP